MRGNFFFLSLKLQHYNANVISARLPSRSLLFFRCVGRLRAPKRGAHSTSVLEPERPGRAAKFFFLWYFLAFFKKKESTFKI